MRDAPMLELPSYAVVTPVKDEARHLERTAEALIAQTHQPNQWVIVDDGSSDATPAIARSYAERHEWITVASTASTGRRARGAPIVRAFKHGLTQLRERPEFVAKLDGDLFFAAHYFEWVAAAFSLDPRAGIVGGLLFVNVDGEWVYDRVSRRTVHGAIKAYRYACLEDIGSLHESMGWDGIDEYGARARGWNVHVLSELDVLHYKERGSAQPWRRARWEEGLGARFMGYRVGAMIRRAGYRMLVEHPPLLGGLTLALGYGWGTLTRSPQADPVAREQLRREQSGLLFRRPGFGRSASASLPDGGPAYWLTKAKPELPQSDIPSPSAAAVPPARVS